MSRLVSVEGLRKHFPVRPRGVIRAVDGVSFEIEEGETLGVVGESGSGKSTLARALLRLEEPSAGRVMVGGLDVTALPPRALRRFRRQAQMIFQDPYGSLDPRQRVESILAEPLAIHGLAAGRDRRTRVAELLERVGLRPDALLRYPHEFSGGQRQRIGIARALAVEPRLIVADEPLSALDLSIQAQIVNLLIDLQQERGLTYLFISHDLRMVQHLADRVAVMYLGKIVEQGPAYEVHAVPRHPYTQALLAAIPEVTKASKAQVLYGEPPSPSHPPAGCPFHPRCPLYVEKGSPVECRTMTPPLEGRGGHLAACHFSGM